MSGGPQNGDVPAVAGFVLAGGRSLRMGRDKALLPLRDSNFLAQTAGRVRQATGSVTVIGPPGIYGHLGWQVVADSVAGCGPMGGLYTALRMTRAEWNLIVACDMPNVTAEFLKDLLKAAASEDCVIPEDCAGRLHPLCAVYHVRCLPILEAQMASKSLKMHNLLNVLKVKRWLVQDKLLLQNLNTPHDWEQHRLAVSP